MSESVTLEAARVQVSLADVLLDQHSGWSCLVLREIRGPRSLAIHVHSYEACEAALAVSGVEVARPRSFQFAARTALTCGAQIEHAFVCGLETVLVPTQGEVDTFVARLRLRLPDGWMDIDARPSDALPVATYCRRPIFVTEALLESAKLTFPVELDQQLGAGVRQIMRLTHQTPRADAGSPEEEAASRSDHAEDRAVRRLIEYVLRDLLPPPGAADDRQRRWWERWRPKRSNSGGRSGLPIPHQVDHFGE